MNTTLTIVHDRKRKAVGNNKEAVLEVRVTRQRRSIHVSTGIKVRRSEWVAGRVVGRLDAQVLNDQLAIIYNKVGAAVNDALQRGEPLDPEVIKHRVWQVAEEHSDRDTLIDWCDEQIPLLNISEGAKKHYRALVTRLEEYRLLRKFSDCTTEAICQFDAWLHSLRRPTTDRKTDRQPTESARGQSLGRAVTFSRLGDGLSDAGVYNYHKCLKALLRRARLFGKIATNPYDLLRGEFKRGDRENIEFLSWDEMQRIMALQLPADSKLERARDLFVFQMFTGLSYSDAMAFDFSKYRWNGSAWVYVGHRVKTGAPYISQLLQPVVDVLQHYGGAVPHMDNADYNHELKTIGLLAQSSLPLHSHLARHTFATWMLANGVKVENLRRMLGHKNIMQTMRYAKVLDQSVHDEYQMIGEKLMASDSARGQSPDR
jgi:integrase